MNDFEKNWLSFAKDGAFLSMTRRWEKRPIKPRSVVLGSGAKASLIDIGVLRFEPVEPSQTYLLISSGIHGNETAPIEIVDQLAKDIWNGALEVKVNLMLIIGNPPAINLGKRFESQNLNRLFSGRHLGCNIKDYETERAACLEKAVTDFYSSGGGINDGNSACLRFHYDLHTAIRASQYEKFVVYPFMHKRPLDKKHIAFFGGADIFVVLLGNQPAGTFSYYTSHQFRALSATVELGKVFPFGENDMSKFVGIVHNLRCSIQAMQPKTVSFEDGNYKIFRVKQEVIKANKNYKLHLDDDVKNFTAFKKGTKLASDGGNQKYIVENDGEAIVFPNNNVPIGQRLGVLLEEIKTQQMLHAR